MSTSSLAFIRSGSPMYRISETTSHGDAEFESNLQSEDSLSSSSGFSGSEPLMKVTKTNMSYRVPHSCSFDHDTGDKTLKTPIPVSSSSGRHRSYDVFVGLHGRNASLLRFTNWLRAEMEVQGMSCFVSNSDRARNLRKQGMVERAMGVSSFGIIILTKKSFGNPRTMEELQYFTKKKNLVPLFFELCPGDCLVEEDEKRGERMEKEWKEVVNGVLRVDKWKLEARDGNWRDCITTTVTILASRLGRRSIVEKMTSWREKAETEEFPFPQNINFVGRKEELCELELILFGNLASVSEQDYFELKTRPKGKTSMNDESQKNQASEKRRNTKMGKQPVVWKETEKEIEMQNNGVFSQNRQINRVKPLINGHFQKKRRSMKMVYGRGIACVSGESGIGKTELLLEFAYRHHQRYKMILWVGGESRHIRQNFLNLRSLLDVDVGAENFSEAGKITSFEEQEDEAVARVRKELLRNLPFLLVIDNLESERDWWDHELIMDILPRFGGETHILISTRLPHVMNLKSLPISRLTAAEAMSLMKTRGGEFSMAETDALRVIDEKLGRLTLGLAMVGAILSELLITPSRLLETIKRMPLKETPLKEVTGCSGGVLKKKKKTNNFLFQLMEVCFSIFDHADGPRSLAKRMVIASGWFAPAPIPVSLLGLAAKKIHKKQKTPPLKKWRKLASSLITNSSSSDKRKSESEASSLLLRFKIARAGTKPGNIHIHELVKGYARRRGEEESAVSMVRAIIRTRRSFFFHHPEAADHAWAACFVVFQFDNGPKPIALRVTDLLAFVKHVATPLAVRTFTAFSRCHAALELLRLCANSLEEEDEVLVAPAEKWLERSLCWRPIKSNAQLNPRLWQELALTRASVLETRAKLMLRGGQFDVGDDLIRKSIFIRSSIRGDAHHDTVAARRTLHKISSLVADHVQVRNS